MFEYLHICFTLNLEVHHGHGWFEYPGVLLCLWMFEIQQLMCFSLKSFSVLEDNGWIRITCIDEAEFTSQALQTYLFLSRNKEKQFLLALCWSEHSSEIEICVHISSSCQG